MGRYLVQRFADAGLPVRAVVRTHAGLPPGTEWQAANVLDLPGLLTAFENAQVVVHAAGMVSFNPRHRQALFDTNVEGTRNVVNACLKLGVPRLIHISSVAALGRTKEMKHVDEQSKWVASSLNTHYGESKYKAELEVFRGMEEGLHVSIVNPSVVLAPEKSGRSSAQLFTYAAKEWPFYGEGIMNYVDVRDVAELVYQLYQQDWNGERFIASAGAVPLFNIMSQISEKLGKKKPHLRVPATLAASAAWAEELRARLTGQEPLLTRQSVKILKESVFFDNRKASEKLGITFKKLEETLDWSCAEFQRLHE